MCYIWLTRDTHTHTPWEIGVTSRLKCQWWGSCLRQWVWAPWGCFINNSRTHCHLQSCERLFTKVVVEYVWICRNCYWYDPTGFNLYHVGARTVNWMVELLREQHWNSWSMKSSRWGSRLRNRFEIRVMNRKVSWTPLLNPFWSIFQNLSTSVPRSWNAAS